MEQRFWIMAVTVAGVRLVASGLEEGLKARSTSTNATTVTTKSTTLRAPAITPTTTLATTKLITVTTKDGGYYYYCSWQSVLWDLNFVLLLRLHCSHCYCSSGREGLTRVLKVYGRKVAATFTLTGGVTGSLFTMVASH